MKYTVTVRRTPGAADDIQIVSEDLLTNIVFIGDIKVIVMDARNRDAEIQQVIREEIDRKPKTRRVGGVHVKTSGAELPGDWAQPEEDKRHRRKPKLSNRRRLGRPGIEGSSSSMGFRRTTTTRSFIGRAGCATSAKLRLKTCGSPRIIIIGLGCSGGSSVGPAIGPSHT